MTLSSFFLIFKVLPPEPQNILIIDFTGCVKFIICPVIPSAFLRLLPSQTPFLKRNYKSSLSISRHKADWHHSHGVMTFLSPLLGDTGTIFRIPKRMTFFHFTMSCVRTQIKSIIDCRGLKKQEVYWGLQLSSFLKSLFSGSCTSCGKVVICTSHSCAPKDVDWLKLLLS